jgi:hypothetical protein
MTPLWVCAVERKLTGEIGTDGQRDYILFDIDSTIWDDKIGDKIVYAGVPIGHGEGDAGYWNWALLSVCIKAM